MTKNEAYKWCAQTLVEMLQGNRVVIVRRWQNRKTEHAIQACSILHPVSIRLRDDRFYIHYFWLDYSGGKHGVIRHGDFGRPGDVDQVHREELVVEDRHVDFKRYVMWSVDHPAKTVK